MTRTGQTRSKAAGRLAKKIGLVGALALALGALAAGPALADGRHGRHGGHGKHGWHKAHHPHYGYRGPRRHGPPHVVYVPPPRVYHVPPPRVYYAPPPVYYEPPSISFVIPLHFR